MHSLNEKERLLLHRLSRVARFRLLVPIVVGIFLFASTMNLHLAARYAALTTLDLESLFVAWFAGPDLQASYSGAYLSAIERLDMAVFTLALGALTIGQIAALRPMHRLAAKIIPILEEHHEMPPSISARSDNEAAA
jgi:hypothetical protein